MNSVLPTTTAMMPSDIPQSPLVFKKRRSNEGIKRVESMRSNEELEQFRRDLEMKESQEKRSKFYTKAKKLQRDLYLLLEEPESSRTAKVIGLLLMTCIAISTLLVICQSVDTWPMTRSYGFVILEYVISSIFTIECIARMISSTAFGDPFYHYFLRLMNIIDIVSVVPFYLEIVFRLRMDAGLRVFKAIRMSRAFRIFKFSRYFHGMNFLTEGIKKSFKSFAYLFILLVITNLIFATLAFYAEQSDLSTRDNPQSLHSIPEAMWWSIVTMTTVGYGDLVPQTVLGKIIAIVTGITGMLIIAIPVAILGNNFQLVINNNMEAALIERKREEAHAICGRLSEEEQHIFLMNLRMKQIEENNKAMGQLLNKSDQLYKNVTTDLKLLYHSIYEAPPLRSADTDREELIKSRYVERMMRSRSKKIKLTNVFEKLVKRDSEGEIPVSPGLRRFTFDLGKGYQNRSEEVPAFLKSRKSQLDDPSQSFVLRKKSFYSDVANGTYEGPPMEKPLKVRKERMFRVRSNSFDNENSLIRFQIERVGRVSSKALNDVVNEMQNNAVSYETMKSLAVCEKRPESTRQFSISRIPTSLETHPSKLKIQTQTFNDEK